MPDSADLPLRILYVEDDPVLRTMLAGLLDDEPGVTVAATAADAETAITAFREGAIDVALLDLALGSRSLSGAELGLRLREISPTLPIVIVSQHLMPRFLDTLPDAERHSWSYIQKRGDLTGTELAGVIRATAEGRVVLDPSALEGRSVDSAVLTQLTARQRQALALLATGRDAIGIAEDLNVAHATVRRDLSNAYRVLVPDYGPGDDPRVTAVLEYLRVTRPWDFEA